jgi:large subunit ribosomal protein L20
MPRTKHGVPSKSRKKKILKQAKGYFGSRHTLYRPAREAVNRALIYSYRDRRARKRDFRKLWIMRINAAARINGLNYNRLIEGLRKSNVEINRKLLADLAVNDAAGFSKLAEIAKESLP